MRKMGLFWFAAALLGAALIFSGCETEADEKIVYLPGEMIHLDTVVSTIGALGDALAVPGPLAIGLSNSATSFDVGTGGLTIPDGKLVYILNGTTLKTDTGGKDLTVEGIVYVGIGATLDTSLGEVKVEEGGRISVLPAKSIAAITAGPGTLKVADAASVNNGKTGTDKKTALDFNDVRILGTLEFGTAIAIADVATVLNYVVDGGTLDLSAAAVTGSKPSTLAGAAALSSGKNLIAEAAGPETDTTLSIPANADITAKSDDALAAITGLTVNGSLTAAASAITALGDSSVGVGGGLTILGATIASTKTLTVSGTLNVTGTLNASAGSIVVGSTNTVTLAKASITGDTTTGAVLDGSDGSVTLAATDAIVLADEGNIVVVGTGKLSLLNSEFGAGTYTATGAVTITAVAAGDTIATAATANNGLTIGTGSDILSLLANAATATTYTLKKATAKVAIAAAGITVGSGSTSDASSLEAPATAQIALAGTSAINLGNASKLVLASGAKIGTFTDSTVATLGPSKDDASLGGAVLTKDTSSLVNSSGILTVNTAAATLTGAADGSSSIAVAAVFAAGT